MPTLSLIMIVKDEADCLGDCLESVRGIVDEMVIADTGSSDGTRGIAESFGAKVLEVAWCDDFAAARNAGMAAATGDWLLHLDADETLDFEGARAIRGLVDADGQGADAVELTLANYCDDPRAWRWVPVPPNDPNARGRAGYIRTTLLRLFRNGRGFEYREAVHENITPSLVERGGVIGRADGFLIHHHGYQANPAKASLYLDIARKKLANQPDDVKALHDFAEQAIGCGLSGEAEDACRRAHALDPRNLAVATTLANLLMNRGALGEARRYLESLLESGEEAPHVLLALGAIACREGRFQPALAYLERVLALAPDHVMALLEVARVYDCLDRNDDARAALVRAHEGSPGIEEAGRRLEAHAMRARAEAAAAVGNAPEALQGLVAALKLDPDDPLLHNDIGAVLGMLGRREEAMRSLERALKLAPGLPAALENRAAL